MAVLVVSALLACGVSGSVMGRLRRGEVPVPAPAPAPAGSPAASPGPSLSPEEAVEAAHHAHVKATAEHILTKSKQKMAEADHHIHRAAAHVADAEGNTTAVEQAKEEAKEAKAKVKKLK